jgi:hypothetical protein
VHLPAGFQLDVFIGLALLFTLSELAVIGYALRDREMEGKWSLHLVIVYPLLFYAGFFAYKPWRVGIVDSPSKIAWPLGWAFMMLIIIVPVVIAGVLVWHLLVSRLFEKDADESS